MTQEAILEKETIVIDSPSEIIFRAYVPFFRENVSSLKTDDEGRKYRVVEGAIIIDRRAVQEQMGWTDEDVSDHFTTLWEVDGFLTDVRKINFDFRHNGISTGAEGERSWVVNDYEVQIDDKVLKVRARMLAVRVYEDSQIRIKGKNGETIEDGGLLTNIENGRVFTWSVEFKPVRQFTTRGGLTVFKTYHTPRISFLDVTQGIPDAGGFTLRNFFNPVLIKIKNNIMLDNIKQALENGEITKEELRALVGTGEEQPKEETPAETPKDEGERNIDLEITPSQGEGEGETPEPTEPPAEADTNQDGEISEQEMRSYIKEVKRAFGDNPSLVKEKVESLERMCGDLKKRMDEASQVPTPNDEELEAQRIRALNNNLADIPEKKKPEVGVVRQLDNGNTDLGKSEDEINEEKLLASYRQAHNFKF
jgi:polyhydroxyalkanoate synthesis regulator phasin